MNQLATYKNGNYRVILFDDGTKIRVTKHDAFIPNHAENIDLKITNYCDAGCRWCHEMSTVRGKHADLLTLPRFIAGQELAIGGGNPLDHPDLIEFLRRQKEDGVICNITVNQFHTEQPKYLDLLCRLVDDKLIYGIGVSLHTTVNKKLLDVLLLPNAILHVINRVHSIDTIRMLYGENAKILILGYKDWGRGKSFDTLDGGLYDSLGEIMQNVSLVSFDNLAIEQLDPKRFLTESQWEEMYMGDDGKYTFYIDAVLGAYAKNSTSPNRYSFIGMDVIEMFHHVRSMS